ncbi:MAG: CAP domain-containing protein [Candidatus Sulfotelmatobacter sp.]
MARACGVIDRVIDKKLAMALLLVIGAALLPMSGVMAASGENDGAARQSAQGATLTPAAATAPDIPLSVYDSQAELQLLDLANLARAQAGAPRLTLDAGLCRAARAHAEAMFAARQLSHQFEGEPSLPQRLATATHTQLDQEGENVALDFDAESGHKHLMLSPPHRANLLNAAYNVIGLGVVRSGDRLYIVQDFGHSLPNYSSAEVKERIAATVVQMRRQAGQPDLARSDLPNADAAACSMAQADKLGGSAVHQLAQRYTVMTYTSLHPETLPANASHVLANRNLRSFSVGSCYARTETYPTGVYWVVLSLE